MVGSRESGRRDLVCWSHLRWSGALERTQHLMVRWARTHRVFFVEPPLHEGTSPRLDVRRDPSGVRVIVPRHDQRAPADEQHHTLLDLLDGLYVGHRVFDPIAWYDSPAFLPATRHLPASVVVYDRAALEGVAATLRRLEHELLAHADTVLTMGDRCWDRLFALAADLVLAAGV